MIKQCVVCNADFKTKASHSERRKTCSMKCRGELFRMEQSGENHPNYKSGKAVGRDFVCHSCGNVFHSDKGHEGREPKFCSRQCAGKSIVVERPIYTCLHCGNSFQPERLKGEYRFCSLKCSGDYYGAKMKGIKRPDKSGKNAPGWKGGVTPVNESARKSIEYKAWRVAVFQRDNYTCQECRKRGGIIHADHIKPFALYPELRFDVSNGRTLCVPCHKKTPTYGGRINRKLDPSLEIKKNGEVWQNSEKAA